MDHIDIEDNILTERARLFWFDHCIDKNIRQFIKEINNQQINIKLESLNRMKDLISTHQQCEKTRIDINLSMIALSKENENNSQSNYLSIKQDKQKAFRIKKLFNELPVMEVLKIRKPQVYKSNFLCPRCNDKKETINHLYKCSKADNDVLMLQRIAKDKLIKWIRKSEKFRNIDDLIEEIFLFFKMTKLQCFIETNSNYYSNFNDHKF